MRTPSVVWIPVLFVGAMVYWTLAFGFGGLSLRALTHFDDGGDTADWTVKDSYQSITVNLSDLPDPGDIQTSEAPSVRVDLLPDQEAATGDSTGQGARGGGARQGPGDTAF